MKKFVLSLAACMPFALLTPFLPACKKSVDYFSYVSEYRKSVYYYEDDTLSLKIFTVDKETPYALDGLKGDVNTVTEIYFSLEKSANEVEIQLAGLGGEMNYLAVTQNFYLSFTGDVLSGASVPVTLNIDGTEKKIDVFNVTEEGVIDGQTALKCVREYDAESFANLTQGSNFAGEICVRLLYDEGCYYYVGVCNRDKQVHAYLVDGTSGRIIAERESTAE